MLLILVVLRGCILSASAPPTSAPSEAGRGVTCLLIEPESFVTSTWRDTDGRPCTLLRLRSSSSAFKIY
ncbi:hypothetical protein Hanom_Chr02g00130001 [Helianthus anomalus]